MQSSFLHPKIETLQPYKESKDLRCVGYTADKIRYAVKRESDKAGMPLAEWIGHNICRAVGIPTPEFFIVECPDGELAFGSRWEPVFEQIGSATPQSRALALLSTHATEISAIYGADVASTNPDRHAGNFLFVPRADSTMCLAFDFSQAYPSHAQSFGKPLPNGCATLQIFSIIEHHLGRFDYKVNAAIMAKIKAIPPIDFKEVLDMSPTHWFTKITSSQLIREWDNFGQS